MNRKRWAGLVAAGVMILAGTPAGEAQQAGATTCRYTVEVRIDPGLSDQPSQGTLSSGGETGRIECDGPIHGEQPTGPGTFGTEGRYGVRDPDVCSDGEAASTQSFTIPTEGGGRVHVDNPMSYTYGRTRDTRFRGESFSGSFRVVKADGNCTTKPVRTVIVEGRGTFHG